MTPFVRTKKPPFVLSSSKDPAQIKYALPNQPPLVLSPSKDPNHRRLNPSTSSGRTDHVDLPMDDAPMTPFVRTKKPPFVLSSSKDPAQIKYALPNQPPFVLSPSKDPNRRRVNTLRQAQGERIMLICRWTMHQ